MAKNTFKEDSLSSNENLIYILGYNSIATAHHLKCLKRLKDHQIRQFYFPS